MEVVERLARGVAAAPNESICSVAVLMLIFEFLLLLGVLG
jgi:hypothetical protein